MLRSSGSCDLTMALQRDHLTDEAPAHAHVHVDETSMEVEYSTYYSGNDESGQIEIPGHEKQERRRCLQP